MQPKILIIAEAGVNHNGSLDTAKQLIQVAHDCGADIVKFQTAKLDSLVSRAAPMAAYQKRNIGRETSQRDMLKDLILPFDDFVVLADCCRETGIQFLSTPFDPDSIRFLNDLQSVWKIPSGEITNYPYLVAIAKTGKDVIMSTGMCTLEEVDAAFEVLQSNGAGAITLLHCTTNYPTPMKDVNLKAMLTLRDHCGCPVGYSDHTLGIEIPIAAAALGATVIEKHFTLDRTLPGPDHKASLEPDELAALVRAVRRVEEALGHGDKRPADSERANIAVARKSLVAARAIRAGETFTADNLTTKRPGTGVSPMRWPEIIGTRAARDFAEDELITL